MNSVKLLALLFMVLGLNESVVRGRRPEVVNIGAVLTYDSVIGRVAKTAIEAAVADVNADTKILSGTRLNLIMKNSNCSAFIGAIEVFNLLEENAIAIVGPQSSTIAHMSSSVSSGLEIPLVSFAATDPTLSSLQFPFFLRATQSDSYQMAAMADLIDYYGWKQVIAVFVDDDYGRNGIYALHDELAKKTSKIYKIALPVGATRNYISDMLQKSKIIGPRVYVVHATPDSGLDIFIVAQHLRMMTDEYVWLATDWLCTYLDTSELNSHNSVGYLQGVVGFRQYIPQSSEKNDFMSRWNELRGKGAIASQLNTYGLYAYDAVWAVAQAINDFLDESGNITFTSKLPDVKGKMQLDKLKTFDGGHLLLAKLLLSNFSGLTGPMQFDSDHNLISGAYEITNIDGSLIHTVGYWANHSGLSSSLPEISYGNKQQDFNVNRVLGNMTWPGGKTKTPRGWEVATSEKPLRIGVPYRKSYVEFVTVFKENNSIKGYCIDVFEAALKLLPYNVPYQFVPFGDGQSNPNYYKLVKTVADDGFDAAVGDIAITTNRTILVDFTQPYISTGLVIVVPTKNTKSSAWVFLRPFTAVMWCMIGAFFFLIGLVIWLLEHRVNSAFRGPPKRQCATMFLFSFSTLCQSQQEDTLSTLGRFVMMVWLFLLMVVTSSYTASLTSFLTVQQLSSPITGIESLIASRNPIGYQEGSFARVYLLNSLKVPQSRLISLGSPEEYEKALQLGPKNGGVAAIVDELPYVELFLSKTSGFGIVAQPFTRSGWGFAFPRDSPLAIDISRAILKLSEIGELQRIHKEWFCQTSCKTHTATSSDPNQLHVNSFWGLFLLCGAAAIVSLFLFLLRAIRQFIRFNRKNRDPSEVSNTGCPQVIFSFFNFIDEKEEAIKNMFKQQNGSSQPQSSVADGVL